MDIRDFNRRWLQAWGDKSIAGVLSFYHPDCRYFDSEVADGLSGTAALEAHLQQMFAKLPEWQYQPDAVWPIEGGFCGRWYLDLGRGADAMRLRGFDFVQLQGDRIIFNEVYTHALPAGG